MVKRGIFLLYVCVVSLSATASGPDYIGDAADMIPDNEIWFSVDGIDYCYDKEKEICRVDDYGYTIAQCESGHYRGTVSIPERVKFGDIEYEVEEIRAFNYCANLKEVKIPNTVKVINGFNRSSVTTLTVPESVIQIVGCTELRYLGSITMLNGESIDITRAFQDLDNLKEVSILTLDPPNWGTHTFYNCPIQSCTLKVSQKALENYQKAPGWRDFGKIIGIDREDVTQVVEIVEESNDDWGVEIKSNGISISNYRGAADVYAIDGRLLQSWVIEDAGFIILEKGVYIIRGLNDRIKIKI